MNDEKTPLLFEKLREFYVEETIKFRATDPEAQGITFKDGPEAAVERMLAAVNRNKARLDWLKYNPAMRAAAKRIGITKSADFREFVWQNYVAKEAAK